MTEFTKECSVALLAEHKNNIQTHAADMFFFKSGHPARNHLESFISQIFKKYYNAEIDQFYPNLLSIESDNREIKAVAGVRCASKEALFSEYYLSQPLEHGLKCLYGKNIERHQVVEVGNLAPANVGQMRWLIASITGFLYSAGYRYIVFTAVPGVYNAFKRMDIPLRIMADARQSCLPESLQNKWGPEYYQSGPKVLAGDIANGFNIVKENIYRNNKKLIPLFEKACQLGLQYASAEGNVA
jgi:hypothetical protein